MKLADQIETMRRRMVEEHEFTKNELEHLEKRMLAGDAEIIRQIDGILANQAANATTILNGLLTIAQRIGHLPPASTSTMPAEPKPAVERKTPPPLPPGGARAPSRAMPPAPPHIQPTMAPHLARTEMNEILAAASDDARH